MLMQFLVTLSLLSATRCLADDDRGEREALVYPIPVSPLWNETRHDAYDRIPMLPPQPPGAPDDADAPLTKAEVLRMLQETEKSLQDYSQQELRSRVKHMNATLVSQEVSPTRILPLVGPAQIRTCKYKCTVCLRGLGSEGDGAPARLKTYVVLIESTHIHMAAEK